MEFELELSNLLKEPSVEKKHKHAIEMKFTIERVGNTKRCGNCGEFKDIKEFKQKNTLMPDWKCKDCNKYMDTYK